MVAFDTVGVVSRFVLTIWAGDKVSSSYAGLAF